MWLHLKPDDARFNGIPAPGVGIFDSPTVRLCINTLWVSHIEGLLERLLHADAWQGTDAQIEFATDQVASLLAKLSTIEDCNAVSLPIGSIILSALSSLPAGFLRCDGAAVSRTTYADLFAAIGTVYGTGDGSSTFNLPDLRGRFPLGEGLGIPPTARSRGESGGAETHTLTVNEIPAHNHTTSPGNAILSVMPPSGSVQLAAFSSATNTSGNTGGGQAHSIMPPFQVVGYMIYAGNGAAVPSCVDCATPSVSDTLDFVPLDSRVLVAADGGVYTSTGFSFLRVQGTITITLATAQCIKGLRISYRRVSNAGNNWAQFGVSENGAVFTILPETEYTNTNILQDYLFTGVLETASLTITKISGGLNFYIEYITLLVCP